MYPHPFPGHLLEDLFHQRVVLQLRRRRGVAVVIHRWPRRSAPRLNEVLQVPVVGGTVDLKIATHESQLQRELLKGHVSGGLLVDALMTTHLPELFSDDSISRTPSQSGEAWPGAASIVG